MNSCQHTIGLSVGSYRAQEWALKTRASPFTMESMPSPEMGLRLLKRGAGEVGIWKTGVEGRCSVVWVSEFPMISTGLTQGAVMPGWVVTLPKLERSGGAKLSLWSGEGGLLSESNGFSLSFLGSMWAFHSCAVSLFSALVSLMIRFFEIPAHFLCLWLFRAFSGPPHWAPSMPSSCDSHGKLSKAGRAFETQKI